MATDPEKQPDSPRDEIDGETVLVPLVPSPGMVSIARRSLLSIRRYCLAAIEGRVALEVGDATSDPFVHSYNLKQFLGFMLDEADAGLEALGDDPAEAIARELFGLKL